MSVSSGCSPWAVGIALLVSTVTGAAADEFKLKRSKAEREFVQDLAQLAQWCSSQKLYRDRDRLCETIVLLDPDHGRARQWLKYRRDREGNWVRRRYREPKNYNEKAEDESRARLQAIVRGFVESGLAALEEAGDELSAEARAGAIAALLAVDPENETIRVANREVKSGDTWILSESALTRKRRAKIRRAAQSALRNSPRSEETHAQGFERRLGVVWTSVRRTDTVRVLVTTGDAECRRAATHCEAVFALWEDVLGARARRPLGLTLFYVSDAQLGRTVLASHPQVSPAFARWVSKLMCSWLPGTYHTICWHSDSATRLEWAARMPIAQLLELNFGLTDKQGWIREGVGIFLSEAITGTHQTYFVRRGEYAQEDARPAKELWKRIRPASTDWLAVAREIVKETRPPLLVDVMGKDVNAMTVRDLVVSYAVARYLIEGHEPESIRAVLAACGTGKNGAHALAEITGTVPPRLEDRFRRWLEETR